MVTIYRDIFLYRTFPDMGLFLNTSVVSVLFLAIGIFVFKRYERNFADVT